jgi:uncharacterized repeat protein (TIGR01451 family)
VTGRQTLSSARGYVPRIRVPRFAAAALSVAIGTAVPLGLDGAGTAHAQTGSPLVTETFTHATAPDFTGVGSACLTGAPTAAAPGPGDHPLGGCTEGVGPVPPNDADPYGYLRLTDASTDQSGAVLYNHAIPATQGLDVTFEQWQYGSTTPNTPADGISFFLVNGDVALTHPGAFGGSLGYAQKLPDDDPSAEFLPGVDGGYLGVGLDVLGNYFGDWEHRGNGCAERSPAGTGFRIPGPGANMITVRGPGEGIEGYCFLTATTSNFTTTGPWPSTLPGTLQGPLTELPAGATPQQAQAALEPSGRTVHVRITPAPNPVLTVEIDFHDGTGFHQVIDTPAPEPVPSTYKFGFAGSTGLFTDVHLIRNVVVATDRPLPRLDLVKQVAQPLPGDLTPGTPVHYQYVVTNSGDAAIHDLAVDDDLVTGPITCMDTTLQPGESTTCTATHIVTDADVAAGHITDTASATGTADGTEVISPPSTVTIPIEQPASLTVDKSVQTPGPYSVGQTVTFTYAVKNTGGVPLTDLAVNDDHVGHVSCASSTLNPGERTTCTGTYTITSQDGAAGSVTNTATATGVTPPGATITSPQTYQTLPIGAPHITLTKTVKTPGPYKVGDLVAYSYTVTNTGTTPLHDVLVSDDRVADIGCDTTTLAPDQSTTCHGTYTITRADLDACRTTGKPSGWSRDSGEDSGWRKDSDRCEVTNIATAAGTDPTGRQVASEPATATITVQAGTGPRPCPCPPPPPCPCNDKGDHWSKDAGSGSGHTR